MNFDLVTIGSGPGGYVAALRAAQLGAKVALVEKDLLGGTCLNRGCIPTKALAASANTLALCSRAGEFGLQTPSIQPSINLSAVKQRKDKIVSDLRRGIEHLLKAAGVEVIKGTAYITDSKNVTVDGSTLQAEKILIATGSVWSKLPNIKSDGEFVLTSDEALDWTDVPKSILIIGGGVIGCEFASIFSAFGSKITIVEAMPSILPTLEPFLSRLLAKLFKDRGIEIFTGTTVTTCEIKGNKVLVGLSNGGEKTAERVLVSVGRRPNPPLQSLPLCLSKASASESRDKGEGGGISPGAIPVNEKFETNIQGIFAIGDVTGGMMLAHTASAEAISCVEQMFGNGKSADLSTVPQLIFTSPEIASVGKTSQELEKEKIPYKTGFFPYGASGKARCDNETEGRVAVHVGEKGRILGAHIIGKDATTMIAEAALAIKHHLTAADIKATIHGHPTYPEIFAEAVMDAAGEAIHVNRSKIRRDVSSNA